MNKTASLLRQHRHLYTAVFCSIYAITLCVIAYSLCAQPSYDTQKLSLLLCQLLLFGILHIWCYMFPKAMSSVDEINCTLLEEAAHSKEMWELLKVNSFGRIRSVLMLLPHWDLL